MKDFFEKVWKFITTPISTHISQLVRTLRDFFSSPTRARWYAIAGIIILVIALPVTVLFLQQQTNTKQHAYVDCGDTRICGKEGGCTDNYSADTTIDVVFNRSCLPTSCYSRGKIAGSCGYTPPTCDQVGGTCTKSGCGDGSHNLSGTCPAGDWECCSNSCKNQTLETKCCSVYGVSSYGTAHLCNKHQDSTCTIAYWDAGYSASCENPNRCSSPNHPYTDPTTGQSKVGAGSCEKYQCSTGEVSIGGDCSPMGDSVCCVKPAGPINYKCISSNDPSYTAFSGDDGSVTYCDTGKMCVGSTQTNLGPNDAKGKLCQTAQTRYVCANDGDRGAGKNEILTILGKSLFPKKYCSSNYYCHVDPSKSTTGVLNGKYYSTSDTDICAPNYDGSHQYPGDVCASQSGIGVCMYHATTGVWTTSRASGKVCARIDPFTETCNATLPACANAIPGTTGDTATIHDCGNLGGLDYKCCTYNNQCKLTDANTTVPADAPAVKDGRAKAGEVFHDRCIGTENGINKEGICAYGRSSDISKVPNCNDVFPGTHGISANITGCNANLGFAYKCCVFNDNYCPNSTGGGTCGQEGKTCCANNTCENSGLTCNSSNVCEKTTTTTPTGGGGGGGGGCTKGQTTGFALSLKLDGIGNGQFENSDPKHPNRKGHVRVFNTADPSRNIHGSSQALNHGKGSGKFDSAKIDLKTSLTCDATYKVEVKLPGYLPASGEVKYGDDNQTISLEPLPGDINRVDLSTKEIVGDGKIGIEDYSIYRQCLNQDPTTPIPFKSDNQTVEVVCGDLINFFDFQDGGTMESVTTPSGVGEWDANYNLWLRSYIKANGF